MQSLSKTIQNVDLWFKALCSLLKNDAEPNMSLEELTSTVKTLTPESSANIKWILRQMDQEIIGFWKKLLNHNPALELQEISLMNLGRILDTNRKTELLKSALVVYSKQSPGDWIRILDSVSSYWDLIDQKTAKQLIIPTYIIAFENEAEWEKEYATRGI